MRLPKERLDAIFEAALALETDQQRSDFLSRACTDPESRKIIEERLAAHARSATSASAAEPPSPAKTIELKLPPELPEPIEGTISNSSARYKLLEKIGEGGCGIVYAAEQSEPVRRRVALKIIKLGMDTKQVVARFEAERQALAMMDHPNIARVFDAGTTDTGRPYFVMEFVRGIRITEYCDENNLSNFDRLDLFMQVCDAIQHAHQKGIIHRDIKPSNILVSVRDGAAVPKVIDFGIAKATEGRLTDATVYTQLHQFIGTPAYMSPEQAEMSGLDIDTRSDIYSLGVLLYELLSGRTPFDAKDLIAKGIDAMRRIIREEDPVRPSTKLAALKQEELTTTAKRRSLAVPRLIQQLKGDLDWIVMKCLEKDRRRRYETANGLAVDIKRFLAGEPVLAAPPGTPYRFKKFLRRHRGEVAAAGVVFLVVIFGLIGTVWQANAARKEAKRALAAEAQSHQRATELQRVADFQAAILAQIDIAAAGLRLTKDVRERFDTTLTKTGLTDSERATQSQSFASQWSHVSATDAARDLIDSTILKPALSAIEKQFGTEPRIAATLRRALAERYHEIGLPATAAELGEKTYADLRQLAGVDDPETLAAASDLAAYYHALSKYDEEETFLRDVIARSRRVLGNQNTNTLLHLHDLSILLATKSKLNEAETNQLEALEGLRRSLGEDHPATITSLSALGFLYQEQGKLDQAEKVDRDVVARRRRVLGDDHKETLISIKNLGTILKAQGKLDEAIAMFREVVQKQRVVKGEVHPSTLSSMEDLGATLDAAGQSAEAETILRDVLAKQRALLGSDHIDTLASMGNLSVFLLGQEKFAEAEPLCRETLERRTRVLGKDNATTLIANNAMGMVLIRQDKLAEGEVYWQETANTARRVFGPGHPETLVYLHNLAGLSMDQDKYDQAEKLFREVLQADTPNVGATHPTVLSATRNLGELYLEKERYNEAVELLASAEPAARKTFTGSSLRSLARWLKGLGNARSQLGKFELAETNLVEAMSIVTKISSPTNIAAKAYTTALYNNYKRWNEAQPGKGYDAKMDEWKTKLDAFPAPPAK